MFSEICVCQYDFDFVFGCDFLFEMDGDDEEIQMFLMIDFFEIYDYVGYVNI